MNFFNIKKKKQYKKNNLIYRNKILLHIPKILLDKNKCYETYCLYFFKETLWQPKISILKNTNLLIKNSNHFIDYYELYQENGNNNCKSTNIYSNISYTYDNLINTIKINKNENNNLNQIKIISEKCIFLSSSFSSGNAGHSIYYIFNILSKYIDTDIKFLIFGEIKNNTQKIINLLVDKDRIITLKSGTIYNFKNEIFDYESSSYKPLDYINFISIIRTKIDLRIKQNIKNYEKLLNKNIFLIKNNKLKNKIRNEDCFIIDYLEEYLNKINYEILNPETDDLFIFAFKLLHAKNIFIGQRGISCFNQMFLNLNSNIICVIDNKKNDEVYYLDNNKLLDLSKFNNFFKNKKKGLDILCNSYYFKHIKGFLILPVNITPIICKKIINLINYDI